MSKHTPGPWQWVEDGTLLQGPPVPDDSKPGAQYEPSVLCACKYALRNPADAWLIAAAPDLLDACEDFREFLLAGLSVAQAEHARGNPGAAGVKEVLNGRLALVEAAIEKATKGVVG